MYKNALWFCPNCEFTKPWGERDPTGIFCAGCGTEMVKTLVPVKAFDPLDRRGVLFPDGNGNYLLEVI